MPGSDLLLTTWQGGGNLPPQLGLARRLVAAGHRVRVLSEPTVEADARAVGCSFMSWPTAPSIAAVRRDTAVIKDWTLRGRIATAPRIGREVLFGPAGRFARDVPDTLERHPADAVLADVTQFGALIGAERSGLPTVGLLSSIYVRPTPGHPVMGSGAVPPTGPVGRLRDAVAPRALLRPLSLGLPQPDAVRADLGMAPMAHVLDLWDRCDRVLVMTSPTFPLSAACLAAGQRPLRRPRDRRPAVDVAVADRGAPVRAGGDELDLPGPRGAAAAGGGRGCDHGQHADDAEGGLRWLRPTPCPARTRGRGPRRSSSPSPRTGTSSCSTGACW